MNKIKLTKGCEVIVIAGKDKGKTGKVIKVIPAERKVVVSGVNIVKKHTKPSKTDKGGIIEKNMPIDVSNVSFLDSKTKKPSRVGFRFLDDGKKEKYLKRSGEVIG